MQKVILLSEEEYQELANKQNEPNILLQRTIDNLKESVTVLAKENHQLKEENAMFALSGASKRNHNTISPQLREIIATWNVSSGDQIKPRSIEVASSLNLDPSDIRAQVRAAIHTGLITRERDLTLKEIK